jgi:UDP-glucose 4-epimerase
MKKYLIIGGAGFIGSNFVEKLLDSGNYVVALDNLCSGNKEFLEKFLKNPNFHFIEDEIVNWQKYEQLFSKIDVLIHLASNADIAAAIDDPTIDFYNGTLLTQQVAELARTCKIPKLLYASGSGVYGDQGKIKLNEADYALVGMRTGKKFRMGDSVKIKVVAANLEKRQLDYHWVQEEGTAVLDIEKSKKIKRKK